jgi:hypothetical protein
VHLIGLVHVTENLLAPRVGGRGGGGARGNLVIAKCKTDHVPFVTDLVR